MRWLGKLAGFRPLSPGLLAHMEQPPRLARGPRVWEQVSRSCRSPSSGFPALPSKAGLPEHPPPLPGSTSRAPARPKVGPFAGAV